MKQETKELLADDAERKPVLFEWSVQQDPSSWEPKQPVINTLPHITRLTGWQKFTGETVTIPKISMVEIDKRLGVLSYQNAILLEALIELYEDVYHTEPKSEVGKKAKRAIEMCEG